MLHSVPRFPERGTVLSSTCRAVPVNRMHRYSLPLDIDLDSCLICLKFYRLNALSKKISQKTYSNTLKM